ncbi:MAG: IS66 family insertion sequence element accessory protein TnpA [Acidiferrobacter sp.]
MAKIRSHEAWQELFAEYEAGQESARDFCARHGLRLTYFYRRSLELRGRSASRRGREGKPVAPPAAFVPVTVTPRGLQAPIDPKPGGPHCVGDTVTLRVGKATMTLSSVVSPAWVAALVMALEA